MKLIIAGSRTIEDSGVLINAIDKHGLQDKTTEVVSGACRGVDLLGEIWANHNNKQLIRFRPDWDKFNKAAGPIRNRTMAEYADALLLIWDGKSKGSANMKKNMEKLNKPIYEVVLSGL